MNEHSHGADASRFEALAGNDADPIVTRWMAAIDPARDQPEYWTEFHDQVMNRCQGLLELRRAAARPSISATLNSWRSTLVPAALAAAALAALLLWQPRAGGEGSARLVELDEWLMDGVEVEADAAFFGSLEPSAGLVVFAAESF
jgi:hypothetical protein